MDHLIDISDESPSFEDAGHEDEEGDGIQEIVYHEAEDAGWNNIYSRGSLQNYSENDAHRPTREGHGQPEQHKN
jgi:hypothetical protein